MTRPTGVPTTESVRVRPPEPEVDKTADPLTVCDNLIEHYNFIHGNATAEMHKHNRLVTEWREKVAEATSAIAQWERAKRALIADADRL
jgi:hypothetical protein